jgi:hypothetical protein
VDRIQGEIKRLDRDRRSSRAPPCKACSRFARAAIFLGLAVLLSTQTVAAEKFQKLSGSQIRARFAGMEMTDGTHWADVYLANGALTTYSMGRKTIGKWDVQKDELCVDRGKDDAGCYQVWLSGNKVELRREGASLPMEGVLQRPAARN